MDNGYINTQVNNEVAKYALIWPQELKPSAKTMYPYSAEREYARMMRAETKVMKQILMEYIPRILDEYERTMGANYRYDDIYDFNDSVTKIFQAMYNRMVKSLSLRKMLKDLKKIANLTGSRNIREWKKIVRDNLGIDLAEDVFKGDIYQKLLKEWTKQNVELIKTVPKDTLGQLEAVVLEGYKNGLTSKKLRDLILESYNVSVSRAEFWARDQVAKLNADITEEQHRAAGVTKYRWSTSKDQRVRDCHRFLEGKIFSYDNPPEQWYVTKSRGIVHTGMHANPGKFYNCRCVAYPVFEKDSPLLHKDSRLDSLDDYDDYAAEDSRYCWDSVNLDDRWITVNGTHVQIDKEGNIQKGPRELKKKPGAWGRGFPKVLVHTTTSKMKSSPDYNAAKHGDYQAAKRLVRDLCKADRLDMLAKAYPDAVVVPVMASTDGANQIPKAYADLLGEHGMKVSDSVKISKKATHTGKSELERLLTHNEYTGKVEKGRKYVIVDDVVTNGGTVNGLRQYIEDRGGKVAAISTLTSGKGSTQIAPTKETIKAVYDKHGEERVSKFLQSIGLKGSVEAMTNREANYIRSMSPGTVDRLTKQM